MKPLHEELLLTIAWRSTIYKIDGFVIREAMIDTNQGEVLQVFYNLICDLKKMYLGVLSLKQAFMEVHLLALEYL